MSYYELRVRVASAFRAMKAMGISEDMVKPVLKSLLRLYGENWELIEKENYRTLADAIFERDELEAKEHTKEIVDDEVAGPSKKILNNYTEDCLGEEAQAIKEAQAAKEPGRPLKKLRLRYQYGQSSSLNTRNTLMPQTPLVIPKDEPNELPSTHLPKVNGSQDNVESPQPNGENITVEGSKGKQPISPKCTNSISRSQSVEMSYDELRARVASAFHAAKAMGISDDKVKPVLKSLLRLYGENWELIEKENYRTLADAIFERDKLEAEEHTKEIEGNKGKQPISPKSTNSISRSQPNTQSRTESRSQHHPMRLRDRRKGIVYRHVRFRRKKPAPQSSSHAASPKEPEAESPKRKSTSSHALVKPKDEPITNMPHLEVPDVTTYPDKSNGGDTSRHGILGANFSPEPSALQSVSESETSDDTGELAKDSNSSSNFEIASSSLGEVKISLCCDLASGRPDFKMPNLDAVLKSVEDKYLRTPQTLNPNISLMNLMKELCQGFLKLGTDPNSQLPKTIYSVSKSSAADALGSKGLSSSFVNGSIEPQRKTPVLSPACNGTNDAIVRNGENQEICTEEIVDIAKGHEKVVITLVNEVNDECPPSFHYIPQNAAFQNAYVNFSLARIGDSNSCATCSGDCLSLSHPCACSHETGGEFAYTADGLVKEELLKESISMNRDPKKHCQFFCKECPLERSKCDGVIEPCRGHLVRRFIKECWWKCGCNKQCGNRVVQRGITRNLQVFMTPGGKGWGLRTLEDLPKGAFVCEYVGEVLTNAELFERVLRSPEGEKHSYPVLLDADWCAEGVLKDEEALCLDATFYGNVARFINHRCHDSTLVEIPVEVETPDHHYYHLAFFTTRKVKAMEELTWDYGIDFDDHEHPIKAFRCQCGSRYCRNMKRSRRARR